MSLNDLLIPVQKEIAEMEQVMLGLLSSHVPFVQSVAEYTIRNGGKRLRPALVLLSARLSGATAMMAHKMGACLEFIHTASLLHDDVIDNAKVRRGKASTNAKWGNHVSVLVGDFFYCRASQLLTEQGDWRILKAVTDAITALTEGEVLEITKNMDFATTETDYLAIIRNKTAVLFQAACQVGGLLGKLADEPVQALGNYGLNLGMAFQLSDDVLDYVSPEEVTGKEIGIDLQEGKLTLPLIAAIQRATPAEQQKIKSALMAQHIDKSTFEEINTLIKKYDGFAATYELARGFLNKAKDSLACFRSSMEKDILIAIADFVSIRDR